MSRKNRRGRVFIPGNDEWRHADVRVDRHVRGVHDDIDAVVWKRWIDRREIEGEKSYGQCKIDEFAQPLSVKSCSRRCRTPDAI